MWTQKTFYLVSNVVYLQVQMEDLQVNETILYLKCWICKKRKKAKQIK